MPFLARALGFSLIALAAGCTDAAAERAFTTGGVTPIQAALPPTIPAPLAPGPLTLLTSERAASPGAPQLHGWEHAARARRSLGPLTEYVTVSPAAVASFEMHEKAVVTEAELAKVLQKRGFKLRRLVEAGTEWVLECTHFT